MGTRRSRAASADGLVEPSATGLTELTKLTDLLEADTETAHRYFAAVPAEELVALVGRADDALLLALIDRDEVRAAAVPGIVARLDEYAIPERLAEIAGTVRFDLHHGREVERHAVAFGADGIAPVPDEAAAADVVLTTSVLRFVRLVSGQRNAGLELLAGHLDVEGDAVLALAVGAMFRVPGSGAVAVDPTALDPVDVATALADATPRHLRKVMAGGFRAVVLEEIFRRLPDFVDPARAEGVRLTVGFRLTGHESGEVDRYVVELRDGAATVGSGQEGGRRDATITCSGHDFLRLATGHLGAISGVLRGQLKVKGDRAKALQLSSAIRFPQARR